MLLLARVSAINNLCKCEHIRAPFQSFGAKHRVSEVVDSKYI